MMVKNRRVFSTDSNDPSLLVRKLENKIHYFVNFIVIIITLLLQFIVIRLNKTKREKFLLVTLL